MKITQSVQILSAAVLGMLTSSGANAVTIDFSTTMATNWTASAGGAVDVVPYQYSRDLSVTSTAFSNGTFLPGGNLANFDGFWTAKFAFFLPYGATNISLAYSSLIADDRAVLNLNGARIAATGTQTTSGPNAGSMVFTDGGPLEDCNFDGPDGTASGSATTGFIIGATNVLQAIVNNTRDGYAGTTLRTLTTSDGTTFGVKGTVSYSLIAPVLSIAVVANGVRASWLTNYTTFRLETTTNLLIPSSWSPVTAVNNAYVTPHTNRATFFRLVQQ